MDMKRWEVGLAVDVPVGAGKHHISEWMFVTVQAPDRKAAVAVATARVVFEGCITIGLDPVRSVREVLDEEDALCLDGSLSCQARASGQCRAC